MAGQSEDSEEVDVLERQFVLVRHKRKKYRCSCGGCVETAIGPEKLIPGGRYSIGELYAVEDACSSNDERKRIRDQRSRDIVKRIQEWALRQEALPRSPLRRAIEYMGDLWSGLLRFLDDPRLALDNNATVRTMRGVVLGRKNHYGSRSERGTEVAALFYSLIESAKLAGVEPDAYRRTAARLAVRGERITLPHELSTP